jgi:hypothetical protein
MGNTVEADFQEEAVCTFLLSPTVGIVIPDQAGNPQDQGSGVLIESPSGRCVVLTAAHIAKYGKDRQLWLAHQSIPHGIEDFVTGVALHPDGLDVALLTVSDQVVRTIGNHSIPVDLVAQSVDEDTDFEDLLYVVGVPVALTKRLTKKALQVKPVIYGTGVTDPLLDDSGRICIEWDLAIQQRGQEPYHMPLPDGVSGGPVWRLRSTKAKLWTARNFGKLVAVQSSFLKPAKTLYAEPAGKWSSWFHRILSAV